MNSNRSLPTGVRQKPFARHGRLPRQRPLLALLRILGVALAVLLVSALSISAIAIAQLRSNVSTVVLPDQAGLETPPPGVGEFEGGFNMLIVGSDECVDTGGCPGREEKLNDFTMLLHVADDHQSAVAVTFPRDLIVQIPACPREDGSGEYPAMSAQQFNVTLTYGGLPCTVLTVRELSGLPVAFAGVMTFAGVREISTAIGGVPVCIDAPINDPSSGLNLPTAGEHEVQGEQALQFLRTRYGIGDGSDTARIGAQQAFLSSMLRKIKSEQTLSDPVKLFSLATVTSRNMILSDNLPDLTLASMALIFKDIPLENVVFVKYPTGTRDSAPGRVFPLEEAADELFQKINADEPVIPDQSAPGVGTVASDPSTAPVPNASETPVSSDPQVPETVSGATGQTADEQLCAKANN